MRRMALLAALVLSGATAISAIPPSVFTLSRHFAPEPSYNPVDDIKSWKDQSYFREHGSRFLQSQSRAESADIRRSIDTDVADAADRRKRLDAALLIDFLAVFGFLATLIFNLARRSAPRIKEAALNTAADGLRTGRKLKSTAWDLGKQIKSRADNRTKT